MAKEEKANPYEGLGTGGKFRKRLFRSRTQTTPYDRPPTSLRNKNGWLSKVVDPAQRLITYSAHSLFSSLFRKRLTPSQSHPSSSETEPEVRHSHQEEASFVSNNSSGKQQGVVGESDVQINCSNGGGLTELEKLLRQKTFTRSEIDHLTSLMHSRTVDAPIRKEEKQAEVAPLEPMLSCEQKEDYPKTPVLENGMENRLVLTPHVTSSAPIDDVASPAELAKAYMGSRPSKVSSSMFGVQSPALREDPTFLKCENLPLKSPVMSVVPRTVRHAGVHENGFATPRTRGRSAIYNMARTPYARIYPTSTLKRSGLAVEREPASSTQSALDQDMLSGYKQGAVKHRSSALDNDIGSVGPIRRIRHKSNLLYSKGSSLPLSGSSLSIARSGVSVDAAQQPSSSIQNSTLWDKDKHNHKLSEENVDYTRPTMSYPSLPSKSSEVASKILQQLDKLVSPKEKSSELRPPTVNDKSPMKLLHGQALQSMETVGSSKLMDTIKDNKLDADLGNLSASTQKLTSQVDKIENGSLKLLAPSDGLVPAVTDAHSTKPGNQFISSATSVDSFMMKSVSYPPQKKRAFHMSAHEDCLDLDDDAYPNGTVSSVFPVEKEVTGPSAMAEKTTSGTETIAEEKTPPLSVVMPPTSSTIGGEAHVGTGESADGSRVGEKVDVSTSVTSSIPGPTFKPVTFAAATETSFGSNKPASPNGSIANPPVFNFGNKLVSSTEITSTGATSKDITNSRPIFGLEKVVSSKEPGADSPLVNFGTNDVHKVPQMLFTSSSSGGESTLLKFSASSDSKLGSSTSSITAGATDALPKVGEFGNADTKSNTDSVRSSELAVSSAASTSLFTSPTSIFGHSNGSLAASPSFSSPFTSLASNNFTSQNVFSSSSLVASSSIGATSTPSIIASSNSSSSNPLVASSSLSSSTSFTFGSSPVPSKGLPISSSGSEPLETKSRQDAGNGNLSSTAFGSSSAAVGSTENGPFGFSSSAMTTINSQSHSSVIGASNGSVLDTHASPAISGFATSTQTQSDPFGSAASSPSFGLTGNTAFSSGNSLFPSSSPATNAFSSGSSLFNSSSSATNIFNSGTTFGLGTSASSTAANSVSSNSGPNSAVFGTSNWQHSKSPFGSAFNFSSSSSGFSFGTSTASVASTSSPTMFSSMTSSSTPQFSFTSAVTTTSTQPAFGSPNSLFAFGSAPVNNDQMGMEDSMAEDTVQSTRPATPIFGQQPAPVQSNFVFGASTPSGANPFQFGSQPNIPPQNPSPFQASGSLEFSAGGSFSLGTGGGDKSGRKIVKVKHRLRKK